MDAVQPTHGDPIAHGAGAETELDELPERDDPVLAGSELRDRPIQRGVFDDTSARRTVKR